MSYVLVQPDFTGGNKIEIAQKPDSSGVTVDRQVVTLGTNELENTIVDLLLQIRNELRAQRIQDSQGMNTHYDSTENLTEPNQL